MGPSEQERLYDEWLVLLARTGDVRAGERLAARWHPRLHRTAQRLMGDREHARDVVQETWAAICKGWLQLMDPARFPAWAFGILRNKCADRIGRLQHERTISGDLDRAPEPFVESMYETAHAIEQALAQLGEDHRLAAILHFAEGLTLSEIAEVTNVPPGTVKSRIFHARKQLKIILKGDSDE